MPFLDKIRGFFGLNEFQDSKSNNNEQPRNNFRNPIWQDYDDEEDEDDAYFQNSPDGMNYQFSSSDPFEIFKALITLMDNTFGNMNQGNDFFPPFEFPSRSTGTTAPHPQLEKPTTNLRDKFLKSDTPEKFVDSQNSSESSLLIDSDLDGQVTTSELATIFDGIKPPPEVPEKTYFSSSTSMRWSYDIFGLKRSQEKRTFKDTDGKVTITTTKKMGDHVEKTVEVIDKNGLSTKTLMIEADENSMRNVEEPLPPTPPEIYSDIFSELFKSTPKL